MKTTKKIAKWLGEMRVETYRHVKPELVKVTGVSKMTWSNWENGKNEPSEDNIIRIAAYCKAHELPFPYEGIEIEGVHEVNGHRFIHAFVKNDTVGKFEDRYVAENV